MPEKDPLDDLFRDRDVPAEPPEKTGPLADLPPGSLLTPGQCAVVVLTLSESVRAWMDERLMPVVKAEGFSYHTRPKMGEATEAAFVVMDVTPETDARLHNQYDRILRIKKSLRRKDDTFCVFGPRAQYRKYPRGTYPGLLYFCMEPTDLDYPEPDLTADGLPTIEGPTLFSFRDMPQVLQRRIRDLKARY
jgi:hypothetical protein